MHLQRVAILLLGFLAILVVALVSLFLWTPSYAVCEGVEPHSTPHERLPVSVALTTLPSRLSNARRTLASLSCQEQRVCQLVDITLYLPRQSRKEPHSVYDVTLLDDLRDVCPLIHVRRVDDDDGPATKWLAPCDRFVADPRHIIFVCDDDMVYHPCAVDTIAEGMRKFPQSAVALRGWNVHSSHQWGRTPLLCGKTYQRCDVVTGVGGFGLRAQYVNTTRVRGEIQEFFQSDPGAACMDDIWLSGELARNEVTKYIAPNVDVQSIPNFESWKSLTVEFFTGGILHSLNEGRERNNNVVLEYFRGFWRTDIE